VPADGRDGPNGRAPAPGRRPPPPRRPRLPRGLRLGGRIVAGALALIVLAAAGAGWFMDRTLLQTLSTSDALAGLRGRAEADQNILLMGLDSRKDMNGDDLPAAVLDKLHAGSSSDVGGYNTNTLILLHVPADGSRATALSIPRDDYVDLPGGLGKHKIKEAYGRAKAHAEQQARRQGTTDPAALEHLGREAGRRAAIEAVRDLLGVQVDHFAEINLAGFYDLADALGGVTVCLRAPAHDTYSGADFPAGVQTLNGAQALAFVRQRHNLAGGDLDRTHRQQAFLASAAAKLNAEGVFGDLGRLGALLDVAHRDVVVDSGFDPLAFIRQAGALTSGDVSFYTLPIERFATEDGESVNLVDPARVRKVAHELLAGENPDGSGGGSGGAEGAGSAGAGKGPRIPQASADASAAAAGGKQLPARAGHAANAPSPHGRGATPAAGPAPVNLDPPPGVPCVD